MSVSGCRTYSHSRWPSMRSVNLTEVWRRRCDRPPGVGKLWRIPAGGVAMGAMGRSKGSGLLIKGCSDGRHEGHRVDRGRGRVVTEVHLVMDVWSAGVAAAATDADDVA